QTQQPAQDQNSRENPSPHSDQVTWGNVPESGHAIRLSAASFELRPMLQGSRRESECNFAATVRCRAAGSESACRQSLSTDATDHCDDDRSPNEINSDRASLRLMGLTRCSSNPAASASSRSIACP